MTKEPTRNDNKRWQKPRQIQNERQHTANAYTRTLDYNTSRRYQMKTHQKATTDRTKEQQGTRKTQKTKHEKGSNTNFGSNFLSDRIFFHRPITFNEYDQSEMGRKQMKLTKIKMWQQNRQAQIFKYWPTNQQILTRYRLSRWSKQNPNLHHYPLGGAWKRQQAWMYDGGYTAIAPYLLGGAWHYKRHGCYTHASYQSSTTIGIWLNTSK